MPERLGQELVPDGLWQLVQPLIPPQRERPQGGGTRHVDEQVAFAAGLAAVGGVGAVQCTPVARQPSEAGGVVIPLHRTPPARHRERDVMDPVD